MRRCLCLLADDKSLASIEFTVSVSYCTAANYWEFSLNSDDSEAELELQM